MLVKRIIPCLDVKDGRVVKGVQFRKHSIAGDIVELAQRYRDEGADELVFYDITASPDDRSVDVRWVSKVASMLDIPFCVAGGIRSVEIAKAVLNFGADKVSINSAALENPELIFQLAQSFGSQSVVVGIDSYEEEGDYFVYQYTGSEKKMCPTKRRTLDWVEEVQKLNAGEIVLNCMNQDGVKLGYDLKQLQRVKSRVHIPLIASGGAGNYSDFLDLFQQVGVNGALAASVFHTKHLSIIQLKQYLKKHNLNVRL